MRAQESEILKFLGFMWNPLSWVMEVAAVMAIVMANGDHRPPDWQDFVGIIVLLLINSTISYIEERNAGSSAKAAEAAKRRRGGRPRGRPPWPLASYTFSIFFAVEKTITDGS